jgi:hypothetical protein
MALRGLKSRVVAAVAHWLSTVSLARSFRSKSGPGMGTVVRSGTPYSWTNAVEHIHPNGGVEAEAGKQGRRSAESDCNSCLYDTPMLAAPRSSSGTQRVRRVGRMS